MQRPAFCVATVTWARDEREEQLLRTALQTLAALQLPVVVADKGTSERFSAFLRSSPQFSLVRADDATLVGQVQASLRAASELHADFILYTESDKQQFFEGKLAAFLRDAPVAPDVGAVLAARSEASFATFPPVQKYTEGVINHLWERFGGPPGDYSYGPMLLNRALLPLPATVERDLGWGWRHFVVGVALRRGYRIIHLPNDYPCPLDQRVEDEGERLHRVRQLAQNVQGLTLSMRADLPAGDSAGGRPTDA